MAQFTNAEIDALGLIGDLANVSTVRHLISLTDRGDEQLERLERKIKNMLEEDLAKLAGPEGVEAGE